MFRCALNFPGRYIKPTTRLARCAINSPCSRYVCLSVSSASASPFYCSILLIARWPVVFSLGRVACCELVLAIARRAAGRFPATLIAPVPRPGPRAGPRATATGARRVYLPRARRAHATSGASGPSVRAARRDRALAGGPGVRAPAGRLAPPPVASPAVAPRPCARWRASPSRPPTPKLFLLQPTALSATAREASSLDARAYRACGLSFIPPANPPHVHPSP